MLLFSLGDAAACVSMTLVSCCTLISFSSAWNCCQTFLACKLETCCHMSIVALGSTSKTCVDPMTWSSHKYFLAALCCLGVASLLYLSAWAPLCIVFGNYQWCISQWSKINGLWCELWWEWQDRSWNVMQEDIGCLSELTLNVSQGDFMKKITFINGYQSNLNLQH